MMGDKVFLRQYWSRYLGELRPRNDIYVDIFQPTPSPTPAVTQTMTPSITPSNTPNPTPAVTQTTTPTITSSPTQTLTPSITPSNTPTVSLTASNTPTLTPTPSETPSFNCLRAWYDASDISTLTLGTGNTVSQWNDKGPYGYDLTQSNLSKQPIYTSSTLNPQVNFSSVTFNGSNHFMSISGISFTDSAYTYIVVAGISRGETTGYAFSMDGPTPQPDLESNYFLYSNNQGGGTDRVWLGADNISYYWDLQQNSADTISRASGLFFGVVSGITDSTSNATLNDVSFIGSVSKTVSNTITSIAFGAETGNTPSEYAISEMMELRVFDCKVSSAELSFHISEMKSKWQYPQWLVTPTPTPSNSPTPSVTKTPTQSPSQSPSNSPTPSVTKTPTSTPPSLTQTMTPSPTSTLTLTPTQTQTQTPSPTPTSGVTGCLCYRLLNETGSPINYQYDDCVSGATSGTLSGGASTQVCAVDLPVIDPGGTITPCTSVTNCDETSDCTGCS